jgi:hypothetical protein
LHELAKQRVHPIHDEGNRQKRDHLRGALEQLVALFPLGVALISLLGYAYGAEGMYGLGELPRMALPTAEAVSPALQLPIEFIEHEVT